MKYTIKTDYNLDEEVYNWAGICPEGTNLEDFIKNTLSQSGLQKKQGPEAGKAAKIVTPEQRLKQQCAGCDHFTCLDCTISCSGCYKRFCKFCIEKYESICENDQRCSGC